MTPAEIAIQLGATGLCICPNFLSVEELGQARDDFRSLESEGRFHLAGTGRGSQHGLHDEIRRDQIFWLEPTAVGHIQDTILGRFELLQTAINRALFLGLDSFEAHYASYPVGGFYQRHRDAFAAPNGSGPSRLVSVVLYLNELWKPADGGVLRIYGSTGKDETYTDVLPIGGTLVCFLSRESEHEVLPSFAVRRSIAGWFRRP